LSAVVKNEGESFSPSFFDALPPFLSVSPAHRTALRVISPEAPTESAASSFRQPARRASAGHKTSPHLSQKETPQMDTTTEYPTTEYRREEDERAKLKAYERRIANRADRRRERQELKVRATSKRNIVQFLE
jgi:hypothetical protein